MASSGHNEPSKVPHTNTGTRTPTTGDDPGPPLLQRFSWEEEDPADTRPGEDLSIPPGHNPDSDSSPVDIDQPQVQYPMTVEYSYPYLPPDLTPIASRVSRSTPSRNVLRLSTHRRPSSSVSSAYGPRSSPRRNGERLNVSQDRSPGSGITRSRRVATAANLTELGASDLLGGLRIHLGSPLDEEEEVEPIQEDQSKIVSQRDDVIDDQSGRSSIQSVGWEQLPGAGVSPMPFTPAVRDLNPPNTAAVEVDRLHTGSSPHTPSSIDWDRLPGAGLPPWHAQMENTEQALKTEQDRSARHTPTMDLGHASRRELRGGESLSNTQQAVHLLRSSQQRSRQAQWTDTSAPYPATTGTPLLPSSSPESLRRSPSGRGRQSSYGTQSRPLHSMYHYYAKKPVSGPAGSTFSSLPLSDSYIRHRSRPIPGPAGVSSPSPLSSHQVHSSPRLGGTQTRDFASGEVGTLYSSHSPAIAGSIRTPRIANSSNNLTPPHPYRLMFADTISSDTGIPTNKPLPALPFSGSTARATALSMGRTRRYTDAATRVAPLRTRGRPPIAPHGIQPSLALDTSNQSGSKRTGQPLLVPNEILDVQSVNEHNTWQSRPLRDSSRRWRDLELFFDVEMRGSSADFSPINSQESQAQPGQLSVYGGTTTQTRERDDWPLRSTDQPTSDYPGLHSRIDSRAFDEDEHEPGLNQPRLPWPPSRVPSGQVQIVDTDGAGVHRQASQSAHLVSRSSTLSSARSISESQPQRQRRHTTGSSDRASSLSDQFPYISPPRSPIPIARRRTLLDEVMSLVSSIDDEEGEGE